MKVFIIALVCLICAKQAGHAQSTQPFVVVHDSELTRALESMPAVAPTPTGSGTTGNQWWPTDWHYFVMPESVKETLRSDGTPFVTVGDSNVTSGVLLSNGLPKYPIVISLASEAIRNDEIGPLTNYVAAGGFLFVGSSAFTRNTNGTTRGDFAFANELGLHQASSSLVNWTNNTYFTKRLSHRVVTHVPNGDLTWRKPSSSDEINWGISPNHPFLAPHDIWRVQTNGATVVAEGDSLPFLTVKAYGKGYFIYCAAFQPLIGHGGFAPTTYSYLILRKAIEWAFESANLPVAKISPWPYLYDAAWMIRHDLENFTNEMAAVEASAQVEFNNGVRGDYCLCTGTVRDDSPNPSTIIAGLRRAVTNYGATIGPHNGGLKNPNNPSLVRGQYDYWHWGPDEAFDVTPSGYPSGKAYATASISNSYRDVEGWLSGITNGIRSWIGCNFNSTREDSYDLLNQLNVKISGDQKIAPFPHWTLSTLTPNKRYPFLSEPVSDWFVGGLVAQSLEPWHPPGVQTSQTLHDAIDFFYSSGFLINFYSHTLSTGLGDAGSLVADYITYSVNTNLHPRLWTTNGVGIYQWWLQRSNAQMTASFSTNGYQSIETLTISGATHTNTTVEFLLPATGAICSLQIRTNGVLAGTSAYRTNGQVIKLRVGSTVTNASISYYPVSPGAPIFSQAFDGVTAPALPAGWTTSTSGVQSNWVTQTSTPDTSPNAAFSGDATNVGINEFDSPVIALPVGQGQLSFRNNYNLESGAGNVGYDGGVLEIKIGTNAFTDILAAGGSFATGGYNAAISSGYGNPLGGRQAWSGNSSGYISTLVNLPSGAGGQNIQFRWRCATDSGNGGVGWRIDTVSISSSVCLCCAGTNTTPVLLSQSNRTIVEMTALVVTNAATDAQSPPQGLSYQLISPPAGAAIDTNGTISWTPGEGQGPSTNTLTTLVTDNGFPPLSATNSFTVVVTETNAAPVLPAQTNLTINELSTLTVTNTATDSDIPANTLTYTLLAGPTNAVISANGIITWTPTEAQGPGTNTFTTWVADDGSPSLSATNTFIVTVNEVNSAPLLPGQTDRTIATLTSLTVTNTATDSDIPANNLTYTLSAPTNATISTNGVITWIPTPAQNRSTNLFQTVVNDNGSPPLSATNSFNVIVNNDPLVVLDSSALSQEACSPTNNAIDPGETVTVLFAFKNTGFGNTTNLVVTLLQTNGIVGPSGPQTYGVLQGGGLAVTQAFSFAATGICGGTITATFQLQDGATNLGIATSSFALGQTGLIFGESFDGVTAPALPAGWTTSTSNAPTGWFTTNSLADTTPNAAFSLDYTNVGLTELVSPAISLPLGPSQLSFKHQYSLESDPNLPTNAFDGGVLEAKIGTNGFADILAVGGTFVSGGYNRTIDARYSNPLGGRKAWSGTNSVYTNTVVNLPASAAGQLLQLRWRVGTDNGNGGGGWRIDSITITGSACCANNAPTLPTQTSRTIAELSTLVVTNTATDDPANTLSYTLLSPPAGATISTNGIITWMPAEAQGPSTNSITTIVTDNGFPPLSATNSFTVTVNDVNSAPVLTVPTNQTLNELSAFSVSASAIDSDIPTNILTFSLLSPPAGMAINATNGAISWTPTEAQGPGTYPITVMVTDNGSPVMSATNSFTVTVNESNSVPILTVPTNRTIVELSTLNVSASATDSDVPTNILTFSLLSPPAGMIINATNGAISWTPTEAQGPSTNTITVMVTDNGSPVMSATNSFMVTVNESNSAPTLPAQTNRTIAGLATLVVTNTASDSDIPTNSLAYALTTAPTNAVIDTNGVITWTPVSGQVPGTNQFITVATDFNPWASNAQHLSATNSFTVVVAAIHNGPSLPAQSDRTINELTTLRVTNTASDTDVPALALTYTLINPPGLALVDGKATIDTNGVISWTPNEAEGPSTNIITTVVTDNGSPPMSATNNFTVVVNEVNSAPTLVAQTNRTIAATATLTVTNAASDADAPANGLTYLLSQAPTNAIIDANGVITWTPVPAQAPSTNQFTTVATDFNPWAVNAQHLSVTNTFLVTVEEQAPPLVILSVNLANGVAHITWSSKSGSTYQLQYHDQNDGTNWQPVVPDVLASGPTAAATNSCGASGQRFYRVRLLP